MVQKRNEGGKATTRAAKASTGQTSQSRQRTSGTNSGAPDSAPNASASTHTRTLRSSTANSSVTLHQTRSTSSANVVPSTSHNVVPSTSHNVRKRKAAEEARAPASKRKRTGTNPDEFDDRVAARSLDYSREKELDERERDIEKRQAILGKRELKAEENEKSFNNMTTELAEVKESCVALEARVKDLSEQLDEYTKLVEEITSLSSGHGVPSAQWILANLEEEHQCPLCFEIMASPYSLNNGRCGHTFCALCLLKWSFSSLHRDCGLWHEALECPLCRAELIFPVDDDPRPIHSFPFVPARHSDASIAASLTLMKNTISASGSTTIKVDDKIAVWGKGGSASVEWETRERRGKAEMLLLFTNWSTIDAIGLVAIKNRLEGL